MRRVLVGTAAAVLVLSGGVASAAEDPAAGGDDGWEPVPEEFWAPFDAEVCGSVVTITGGDVREAEQRSEVLDDGSTFTEYRGGQTLDLVRASDGATIDELDVSGTGWDLVSPDGTELLVQFDGPSIIVAADDVQRAAAEEAGLPDFIFFEEDTFLGRLVVDPATQESVTADVLQAPEDVVDVCSLLDEAADDSDDSTDDSGDGRGDG